MAEQFVPEVSVTVHWLHQKHGVDLSCYLIKAPTDSNSQYLSIQRAYPPVGFEETRQKSRAEPMPSRTRAEVIQVMENADLVNFIRTLEAGGVYAGTAKRLYFPVRGIRRFNFNIAKKHANIWQDRRFANDKTFWNERFGAGVDIREVNQGASLTFNLTSAEHFNKFKKACEEEIKPEWFDAQ